LDTAIGKKVKVFADRSDKKVLFRLSGKFTVPAYIYKYTVPWRIDGFIQNCENIMQPINYAGPNAQISHIFIKVIKLPMIWPN
jgi:hypothetical protein